MAKPKDSQKISSYIGRERPELSKNYQRKQALQALNAAKLMENQHLSNGGKYVRIDHRTLILKK